MRRASSVALCFALVVAPMFYAPRAAKACGPFTLRGVFTFVKHPDLPLERFARGEIGVLQPTYARSYLFAAYRQLSGVGLTPNEQSQLVSLWNARLDFNDMRYDETMYADWIAARKAIPGTAEVQINPFKDVSENDEYYTYLNCTRDAFRQAAQTLQARAARYGATSQTVKNFVTAQDQVFANCSDGKNIIEATAEGDALARADRAYQAAAAHFYAARFDDAQRAFETIARDNNSPYSQAADFLVARTLMRKATLTSDKEAAAKKSLFTQAEAKLRQIISDPRETAFHDSARRLLSFVRLRAQPEERLRELARDCVRPASADGAMFRQDVWDYTVLLDRVLKDKADDVQGAKFAELPSIARETELGDWLLTFQSQDAAATAHAVDKWRETNSQLWLVAAISKVQKDNPQTPLLLAAANKINASSPAFATVTFHATKLLVALGSVDEARRRLDVALSQERNALPPSTVNLYLSLRLPLARNFTEMLRDAQRQPSAYTFDEDGRELPEDLSKNKDLLKDYPGHGAILFDLDGANLFNRRLPLSMVREAATNQELPVHLRRDIAQAAWVRAILLGNRQIANELVVPLARLIPEMRGQLEAYVSAANDEDAKYTAIYTILKFPGIEPYVDANLSRSTPVEKIDEHRDNWWCNGSLIYKAQANLRGSDEDAYLSDKRQARLASIGYPMFLTAEQKQTARDENKRLNAFETAPNYLCQQAIAFAKARPDDPRAPEALHLAVKATRYGCTDDKTGANSKAAFDLLHKQYPTSEWAKQTKYWYK